MTKRYGDLFEKVIDIENLKRADILARTGKPVTRSMREYDEGGEKSLYALHDALISGTYQFSEYTHFTTIEGGKLRKIDYLTDYRDRIVQYALMNVCCPIWLKTFTHNTFSQIKRRGILGCVKCVQKIIRSFAGRPLYCLKIDLKAFFKSIKNAIAMGIIRKKIKDTRVLRLLDNIILSFDGLPLGNVISPSLANLTLAYFMHFVNEELRVKAAEYADDIVFFSDTKEKLHDVLEKIRAKIAEVGLTIKENFQIFPIAKNVYDKVGRALDYVGYCFYRTHVRIRKSIKQNFCRRVAKINKLPLTLKQYKQSISAWLGWCKHSNSRHLVKKVVRMDYYNELYHKIA